MLDKRQAMSVEGAEPKRRLAKDLENELGEDYYMDMRQHWDLAKDDEKQDIIPEIFLGKNVADFIDPDIMKVKNNKQLLDEVFVISRIIKVEVRVISRSRRLRLITLTSTLIILDITKTESNNCFIIH